MGGRRECTPNPAIQAGIVAITTDRITYRVATTSMVTPFRYPVSGMEIRIG